MASYTQYTLSGTESWGTPYIAPPRPTLVKPEPGEYLGAGWTGIQPLIPVDNLDIRNGAEARKFVPIGKNPIVKSAFDALISGTFWSGYHFGGVNDYDKYPEYEALDEQYVAEIEEQIADLQYETFDHVVKSMLWNGMQFGFSVAEMVFSTFAPWKVEKIKTKAPFYFQFYVNQVGDLERLYYSPAGIYRSGVELEKYVVATYPYIKDGNHYGTSELLSISHDVQLLQLMEEYQALGIQGLAVRSILYWYDSVGRDKREVNDIQNALAQVGKATVIKLPMMQSADAGKPDRKDLVEVMDDRASHEGVELLKNIIPMLQTRIMRTLGVPDDLGFTQTSVGSLAKAKEEMNLFIARLIRNQEFVAGFVNRQIVPAMLQYNHPDLPATYRLPQMEFETLEESYISSMVDSMVKLVDSGIISADEAWVRERLEIPAAAADAPEGTPMAAPTVDSAAPADPGAPGAKPVVAPIGQTAEISPDFVLNGAQITAASAIVTQVAAHDIPRDSGLGQIQILFNLTRPQAEAILGSAGLPTPVQSALAGVQM